MTPSPGTYDYKSSFEKKPSEGITMGLGRDDVKCRDLFSVSKAKGPTPTSYKPEISYNTRINSMGKRLSSDT